MINEMDFRNCLLTHISGVNAVRLDLLAVQYILGNVNDVGYKWEAMSASYLALRDFNVRTKDLLKRLHGFREIGLYFIPAWQRLRFADISIGKARDHSIFLAALSSPLPCR
jgi:hypothetical protein